jgi:hypothetical protein
VKTPLKFVAAIAAASAIGMFSIAPAFATDDINLMPGGSIKNSDGLIGLVGEEFNDGDWSYTELLVGNEVSGAEADCESSYDAWHILCDPAPTTNTRGVLTSAFSNTGYTSSLDDASSISFLVVDLGQVSTFSSLEIYQMIEADGKVTHAEMFTSSADAETWPTQGDGSWTSVTSGTVANGTTLEGSEPYTNTSVTTFDFDATASRYVMFYFQNDGTHVDADEDVIDGYIEVAGVKLFGSAGAAAAPTPVPEVLATTGMNTGALAGFAGIVALLLLAGAGMIAVRRTNA